MTTGPVHWELLQKARAVDNQFFVAACSPARSADPSAYQAWGHSSVVGPWAEVLASTGHGPDIVYADLDLAQVGLSTPPLRVGLSKVGLDSVGFHGSIGFCGVLWFYGILWGSMLLWDSVGFCGSMGFCGV